MLHRILLQGSHLKNLQPLTPATTWVIVLFFVLITHPGFADNRALDANWSDEELRTIRSLWIGNLAALPDSPNNTVADDPDAMALGKRIFFDTAFSRDGGVACASCHQPQKHFSDGLAKGVARGVASGAAKGVTIATTGRRTMSIVGAAYSPWLFWDGRSDSLWAQALAPLEDAAEHGGTRTQYVRLLSLSASYRIAYEKVFGPLPSFEDKHRFPVKASPLGDSQAKANWSTMSEQDKNLVNTVFANIGRALEAYQRLLLPAPAEFDRYVETLVQNSATANKRQDILNPEQIAGLRLFIGKAQCTHCHNGPLLSNNEFHNTGLFPAGTLPTDRGRVEGARIVQKDEFNCLGHIPHSQQGSQKNTLISHHKNTNKQSCEELRFVKDHGIELVAAFRTPSLRNVRDGPFMHTGEFTSMQQVLNHYNEAPPTLISDELDPLGLTDEELMQIELFLQAVESPIATEPGWLQP